MRVLYLTGMMRCGSTMIGNVLGETEGTLHVGELHYLWRNGVLDQGTNSSCGCGSPLSECPLWSDALDDDRIATAVEAVQATRLRARHTPRRLAESIGPMAAPPDVRWLTGLTADVYRRAASVAGADVVVDGSKYPAEAAAMLGSGLDVRVLHVVRDARATTHSYRKDKSYVERMSAARSTGYWTAVNAASDLLALAGRSRYLRVRHEDFSARPAEVIDEVMAFAGITGPNPVSADGTVELGVNHTVTGNPDRFHRGRVLIGDNARWRTELDWKPRTLTTAASAPQLLRYGYPVLTRRDG
ncbi:sulfotransferase family protein [Lentzea pudingi]|uniref:Sulfotransferase family protein n=1 Tax=Lentzea pudingi TaxID=1789439 RepID=A0ABQ2IJP0_9PSEU|nr:sulfotransferase [Lentzea pudingi]GGN10783.1 sulfotransferase family protein [Lentzea pudingi]